MGGRGPRAASASPPQSTLKTAMSARSTTRHPRRDNFPAHSTPRHPQKSDFSRYFNQVIKGLQRYGWVDVTVLTAETDGAACFARAHAAGAPVPPPYITLTLTHTHAHTHTHTHSHTHPHTHTHTHHHSHPPPPTTSRNHLLTPPSIRIGFARAHAAGALRSHTGDYQKSTGTQCA